jgi:uncharacterized protein HemY
MRLAGETGNAWTLADGQRIMASICLSQSLFVDAGAWAEKAASQFVEMDDSESAAAALAVAAEAAERDGDEERARSLFDRARSLTPA